jgi:hypothetical protein
MAVSLPNGAVISIASGYGTLSTMSVVTNANPAVATLGASHGVSPGDIIEVTSGWSRLNGKIVKAGTVVTNDVQLLGINSTDTTKYPVGAGIGSIREISGWTQLSQILTSASSGGDQQFITYQFLEDDAEKRLPSNKAAAGLEFTIANDPTLAGYILAEAANDDRLPRAIRIVLPNAATIFYNAYISLNKTPTLNVNALMSNQVTLSLVNNEPVRY